jgi:GT2 family glycosyltransferase
MNSSHETTDEADGEWPTVTIVFLVYDRRDELRTSLRMMLLESDYDPDKVEVIVVDNASSDDSAAMVEEEFPQVRLIRRTTNRGVSGWNEGFAVARGDYVLALDDDCYLPPDGLRRSIAAAREHDADLVSFKVISTADPEWVFSDAYRTGLFMFWGCAVLVRRQPLQQLEGYDPEIFVWANELEFMIRFLDRGYRHLHLPGVVAQHMKEAPDKADTWIGER